MKMRSSGLKSKIVVVVLFGLLAPLILCVSVKAQKESADADQRLTNLHMALIDLQKAYEDRDPLKITDLFNSEDIENVGGYEKFVSLLELGGSSASTTVVTFTSPEKIDSIDRKWFGVIPFRMEWREANILNVVETCLVGLSSDDGITWRFKTGESFFRDYPELVGRIQIIERKKSLVNIEQ